MSSIQINSILLIIGLSENKIPRTLQVARTFIKTFLPICHQYLSKLTTPQST